MENTIIQNVKQKVARSISFKITVIVILSLLLLIPTAMVKDMIHERESYNNEVVQSVSNSWGGDQQIMGPFLTLPYIVQKEDKDGNPVYYSREINFTPKELMISGDVNTTNRRISIYDVTLYNSKLTFTGNFTVPDLAQLNLDAYQILYDKAYVSMIVSDQSGIKENVILNWNESKKEFKSGLPNRKIAESGFYTRAPMVPELKTYQYSFNINLNGHKNLSFVPVAEQTEVKLSSPWRDPGFYGNFIPDTRIITEKGFEAEWKIFHLSRNIPSSWMGEREWGTESAFGVSLIEMVDEYQKNMRSAKYAFLIICLTFLTFFLTEIIKKRPLHPFQYTMAGMALVVFYILLLSITEHTGFNIAYLISSILTGGLIITYISAIYKDKNLTTITGIFFLIIYGFIYIILQLEDFSLLVGAAGLFIALAATMMLTRKIDWYNVRKPISE
ncbi:MAG: cell envelope integrity protein CreD [Cyclobacteriaceae bacterium]|nr:cell envelope integrity protein CreD [Cyclobacteriaceae bacterium]